MKALLGGHRSLICVAIAFLSVAQHGHELESSRTGIDFYHYWLVPRILHEAPSANVYGAAETRSFAERYRAEAEAEGGRRAAAAQAWVVL